MTLEEMLRGIQEEYNCSPEVNKLWNEHYCIFPDEYYICMPVQAIANKTMRAKFKVDAVIDYGKGYKKAEMSAVYSGDRNTEDNQFSMATPSGKLEMMISNPAAINFLKPDTKYYIDFTECEDQS